MSGRTARRHLNSLLARLTGYELSRPRPRSEVDRPARPGSAVASGAQTQSGQRNLESVPRDFDDDIAEIVRAARPYTMTGPDKLHALITATRYVIRYNIPGSVVECGVWRGGSMHAVARTLDATGVHDRELYLFDPYEGMTQPGEKDVRHDGKSASAMLQAAGRDSRVWAYASLPDVKGAFRSVPYPDDRVHFVAGPVEETIPDQAPEQISILRLDTDWYGSTSHELKHLYDRLVPGGVLMLDDYGWWQGSRTATDEFLDRTGARLLLVRMGTVRVAVKP